MGLRIRLALESLVFHFPLFPSFLLLHVASEDETVTRTLELVRVALPTFQE
jgi:hypothetical protein